MLCEPRDNLKQGKCHLQGQTVACFWACRPLCLLTLSPAPSLPSSPPGHGSNIGESGPEQRGKNTSWFPNNTFLSTTQTQQGQNEWCCHIFMKVNALETLTESRAEPQEGSPHPLAPHQVASPPQDRADSDQTRWACLGCVGNWLVSPCPGLSVTFLWRAQSGKAS